eukprot:5383886-Amphidinium_carterae.2
MTTFQLPRKIWPVVLCSVGNKKHSTSETILQLSASGTFRDKLCMQQDMQPCMHQPKGCMTNKSNTSHAKGLY